MDFDNNQYKKIIGNRSLTFQMYNPGQFKVYNKETISKFLKKYCFGTIFAISSGEPRVASVPLYADDGLETLSGHFALANPIWKDLEQKEVTVVFNGPNHYISPLWYEEKYAVPTWNYVSVIARGKVSLVEYTEGKINILDELSIYHEKRFNQDWQADWSDDHFNAQLKAIVAFRISIREIEMKEKLSQNHPKDNTLKVARRLLKIDNQDAQEIGNLMEKL